MGLARGCQGGPGPSGGERGGRVAAQTHAEDVGVGKVRARAAQKAHLVKNRQRRCARQRIGSQQHGHAGVEQDAHGVWRVFEKGMRPGGSTRPRRRSGRGSRYRRRKDNWHARPGCAGERTPASCAHATGERPGGFQPGSSKPKRRYRSAIGPAPVRRNCASSGISARWMDKGRSRSSARAASCRARDMDTEYGAWAAIPRRDAGTPFFSNASSRARRVSTQSWARPFARFDHFEKGAAGQVGTGRFERRVRGACRCRP